MRLFSAISRRIPAMTVAFAVCSLRTTHRDSLDIIGHLTCGVEQMNIDERFLVYQSDTAPGSSGSPIFNDSWQIVGVHHAGRPKKDATPALLWGIALRQRLRSGAELELAQDVVE